MNLASYQAWLKRLAEEKRAKEKVKRYRKARLEEWYMPLDQSPVRYETAVYVSMYLGALRMEWHRAERSR